MPTRNEFYDQLLNDPAYTTMTRQVGSEVEELTPQERMDTLGRWADARFAAQEEAAAVEAERELRRDVRRALAALGADITRLSDGNSMTVAQLRPIVLRMARIEEGLIQALISLDLLEDG